MTIKIRCIKSYKTLQTIHNVDKVGIHVNSVLEDCYSILTKDGKLDNSTYSIREHIITVNV